jgi:hypothetical protein
MGSFILKSLVIEVDLKIMSFNPKGRS